MGTGVRRSTPLSFELTVDLMASQPGIGG
jgi:hypothetical protein